MEEKNWGDRLYYENNISYMQMLSKMHFNCPAEPGYILSLQTVQIQISWLLYWSGSALFAVKYVNLYQQSGWRNLIGWKLEVGVAS